MIRGQSVEVKVDYDLFGVNVRGTIGIYLKCSPGGKNLVYFPDVEEWGEFQTEDLAEIPGEVPEKNLDFVSNIKTMKTTFQT